VAKEPIGDTILRALSTIDELLETVGKHDQILTKLDDRLAALEKAKKP
jgi:hypothetical protein